MRKGLHKSRLLCRRRVFAEMLEVRCMLSVSGQALTTGANGLPAAVALQGTATDPAIAPDGSLWYVKNHSLERLSVDGQITTFAMPTNPGGIPQPVISSVSFSTNSTALVVFSGLGNQTMELPVDGQFADAGSSTDAGSQGGPTDLLYAGGGVIVNAEFSIDSLGTKQISPDYLNSLVTSSAFVSSVKASSAASDTTTGDTQGQGTQPATPGSTGHDSSPPPVRPIGVVAPATMPVAATAAVKLETDAPPAPREPMSAGETTVVTTPAVTASGESAPATVQSGEKFVPTESGVSSSDAMAAAVADDPGTFAGEFTIVARGPAPTNHGVPPARPSQMYSSAQGAVNAPGEITVASAARGEADAMPSENRAGEKSAAVVASGNVASPASEGAVAAVGDGQVMSHLNGYLRLWRAAACLCVATGLQLWSGGGPGRRFFVWARRRTSN